MLNQDSAISLLKENGKRVTKNRIQVLSFLIKSPKSYSLSDIETHFVN